MNKIQKVIVLFYILTVTYLGSYVPMVKSWPCGCKYMCKAWIWKKPPLLFDISPNQSESGGVATIDWSIDWRRLVTRLLVASMIALLAFVFVGGKKNVAD